MKRVFDLFFSFTGLILFSPMFFIISLLIKISMSGPVFFKQERVGQYGHLFKIVKFRTMSPNNSNNTVTVQGDERITPLGRFLRRFKLDELPELWNVFTGRMSFVGPRPDVPGYADKLSGESRKILKLKPGITGPATLKYANEEALLSSADDPVRFNNEVIFPDKVMINLAYYNNHTIFRDIKIILSSIFRKNY